MEVDSVGIIAILSVSYITTRIVKTYRSVAKISRVPVENQITTLNVVKIAIKFSPCVWQLFYIQYFYFSQKFSPCGGALKKTCIFQKICRYTLLW